jgi:hypothetical protein
MPRFAAEVRGWGQCQQWCWRKEAHTAKQTKKQSKSATVTKMLSRGTDATVAEIMKLTGWKEHSCRAFLMVVPLAVSAA